MMDTCTAEQALRREAIRRLLQGERPCDICRDLNRGRTWLHKWWSHYQLNPKTDFADRSRSPHTSPHQTPSSVEQVVIRVRRLLEAGQSRNLLWLCRPSSNTSRTPTTRRQTIALPGNY